MNIQERHQNFSIELDCAPGTPRPSDLIEGVLKGTGLDVDDFWTVPPFFGHQMWILLKTAEKDKLFTTIRLNKIKRRVTTLYNRGSIRYGTW